MSGVASGRDAPRRVALNGVNVTNSRRAPAIGVVCAVCAAIVAFLPHATSAYFERIALSSRVQALGGAYVAIADDPCAVVLNPAGLTQIRTASVLSTISEPYGLSDLGEYTIAAGLPTSIGAFGISWHRFGLDGVTSEDLFTFAFGRDLIRTSQDASLSVGAGLDIARVAYTGDAGGASATVVSGTLAVLLRPFPFIGAGYTVRNLGEPSFDFALVPGSSGSTIGRTRLEATHAFGFAYHWEEKFSVVYERQRGQDARWTDRIGVEIRAGDHLRVRSGLVDADVTGGVGVLWSNVTIDAGVTSHDALGLSYLVSVGISLPVKGDEEEGQW